MEVCNLHVLVGCNSMLTLDVTIDAPLWRLGIPFKVISVGSCELIGESCDRSSRHTSSDI